MLFSEKIRIEEFIIEELDNGALPGPRLLERINSSEIVFTKQAFYKSLKKLLLNEVINKTGTNYALNRIWLQKIFDFGKRHNQEVHKIEVANILEFEDGDSVSYSFKNPYSLDITWGHLYDIVYENIDQRIALLNYHPHEWIMISRPETESYFLNRFNTDKRLMLFNVAGKTELDKKFKEEIQTEHIKVNIGINPTGKENVYINVLGDYIFEVTTDPKFEKRVEKFFNQNKSLTEVAQKQIEAISKQKYRSKLKLSKNKKKADQWRKKWNKDFYIPASYYLYPKD